MGTIVKQEPQHCTCRATPENWSHWVPTHSKTSSDINVDREGCRWFYRIPDLADAGTEMGYFTRIPNPAV